MAAITDLTTLAYSSLLASDYFVVHDASAATDKKVAPFEAGTWTPVLLIGGSSTGITYVSGYPKGRYVRVGTLVWVGCELQLTSKGGLTGSGLVIQGLPYGAHGTPLGGLAPRYVTGMASLTGQLIAYISTNITVVQMGATGITALTGSNVKDSMVLSLYGSYECA